MAIKDQGLGSYIQYYYLSERKDCLRNLQLGVFLLHILAKLVCCAVLCLHVHIQAYRSPS